MPEPVGPTTATVVAGGDVEGDPVERRPGDAVEGEADARDAEAGAAVRRGGAASGPYGVSPVASSTGVTRSKPASARGRSASTQPIARIGRASRVNR